MNYDQYLNPRIASVPPSGIRRFFDLASTRKNAISLGVGEPDFKTPYHIRDAAVNSLIDGETQYTANRGLPELREEIARYLSGRYQLSYDPATQIVVTIGASEAIDAALRAVVAPGEEVLVPEPSYVSYAPGVVFAGGVPRPVVTREEDDFRLQADALEAAITPRTKALILPYLR
ncbi:MAG: aminotransferase class I/II-fold pyridoxal phosphate-dependent enzyme, partial [Clostridia bacterium]|nr:aminotransferase class I/II-fold pyridoxal phosphate-dependent enzyme [Clostridia bacterium]